MNRRSNELVLVALILCNSLAFGSDCAGGASTLAPPSDFFKDVYHGRLSDVNDVLTNEPYRAYETNAQDEPVLLVALQNKQTDAALRLLEEYERDVNVLDQFITEQEVAKSRILGRPILIAAGDEQTKIARALITRELQFQTNVYGDRKGLVVLTKPTSSDLPQEVFWLSPPGSSHDYQIAKIVEALYDNGTIDVLRKASGNSLLQIAAENGQEEVFIRLERMFADSIVLDRTVYHTLLCHLANDEKHEGQHLDAFKEYMTKFTRFNLNDVILSNSAIALLEVPFELNQPSIFEFYLENIATETSVDQNTVLTEFIRSSNQFTWKTTVDRTFVAELCIKHNINLLEPGHTGTPLEIFVQNNRVIPSIDTYFNDHIPDILEQPGNFERLFMTLIVKNRTSFISELYESHPLLPEAAVNSTELIRFAYRGGYIEVASLLISLNSEHLTEDDLNQFVSEFSKKERFVPLLQQVLKLQQAEDLIVKHQSTEPLADALFERKLENYRVLFDSIQMKGDLAAIKEGYKLISSAIWSRKDVLVEEFRADLKPVELFKAQSKYDNYDPKSDDSITHCAFPSSYVWSPNYETHTEEYYVKEKEQFDEIFVELLGCGVSYEPSFEITSSLLHEAVEKDNLFATEKLIELGASAMTIDQHGNLPLHLVHSVEALDVLIKVSPEDALTTKNTNDLTPVDVVASRDCTTGKYKSLITALIAKGAPEPDESVCLVSNKPDEVLSNIPTESLEVVDPLFGRPLPGMSKFDSAIYQQDGAKAKILKAAQLIALTEEPTFDRLGYCDTTDRLLTPNFFIRNTVLACLCEAKFKDL